MSTEYDHTRFPKKYDTLVLCERPNLSNSILLHPLVSLTSSRYPSRVCHTSRFLHVRSISCKLLAVQLFKQHVALRLSHTQKSSSVPSSSQSTASSACSPSACNLSNPVSASKNPVSLNALNIIANPCVSYAFTTYAAHISPACTVIDAKRTVSLHPVQRSYAAPTIVMVRNCARNPRSWCGTSPNTLPPSCGCCTSWPGGGAGA